MRVCYFFNPAPLHRTEWRVDKRVFIAHLPPTVTRRRYFELGEIEFYRNAAKERENNCEV